MLMNISNIDHKLAVNGINEFYKGFVREEACYLLYCGGFIGFLCPASAVSFYLSFSPVYSMHIF